MKCPKCKQNLNSQGIHAGQDANYCELRAERDRLRTLVAELIGALEKLRPVLGECLNGENYCHGIRGAADARRQFRYIQSQIAAAVSVLNPDLARDLAEPEDTA